MRLTAFSVRHWQFTVVLFAMLGALGLAAWNSIPRLEDPPIDFPEFSVVSVLPGASPTDLERLVVTEVEKRLDELDDVKSISSRVRDGVAITRIAFQPEKDPDKKYDEVLREINALRPSLPAELVRFDVEKSSTLDVNIMQVALVAPHTDYRSLDSLAESLTDRLRAVAGVRTAERWGAPVRQVDVAVDLGRLTALRMPVGEVLQAIGGESADIPAGSVEAGGRNFSVRSSGSYETLEQIRGTVIRGHAGRLVRVGDVADVRWGYADSTYRARFNGERAAFVTAQQQRGTTVQAVRDAIARELASFERTLPRGVKLEWAFDQAENVSHRLRRLGEDFGIAILLVALTLLPLGLRAGLVVMISIPLSLAIGVTALYWLGFTLNQLTIVGMVIALGLLVDDSIVVVENIIRFRREGRSLVDAAIEGTQQIWVAVLGATATLLFAFVPLLFLPGGPGMFIRSLPVAVVVTVL
ncbi:MAG TPA: efflux RND transporter permease subunit, partial [Gemmatimonadales bacterium]|nr:efflux RND transporter permease subunit [Gemmatimonadales bacterium]